MKIGSKVGWGIAALGLFGAPAWSADRVWESFLPASGGIVRFAVDPIYNFYGTTSSGTLLTTRPGRKTWDALTVPKGAYHVAVDPSNLLYVRGKDEVIYRSEDGGKSWDAVTAAAPKTISDLRVSSSGEIFVLGSDRVVYSTLPFEMKWKAVSPAPGGGVVGMAGGLVVQDDGTIYAIGTDQKVYTTTAGAMKWTNVAACCVTSIVPYSPTSIYGLGTDSRTWYWDGKAWASYASYYVDGGSYRSFTQLQVTVDGTLLGLGSGTPYLIFL